MTVDALSVANDVADLKAALEVWRTAGDIVGTRLDSIEEQLATDATGVVAAVIHDAGVTGPQTFDNTWWSRLDEAGRAAVATAWHDDTLTEADVVAPRRIKTPEARGGDPELIGPIVRRVIRDLAERDPNAPQWAREIGDD